MGSYNVVLEESRRLLNRQEANLDGLRTKAATSLSAAAVVAALFGTDLLKHHHLNVLEATALALFAVGSVLSIVVLQPSGFVFGRTSLDDFISDIDSAEDKSSAIDDVERDLALMLDGYRQDNKRTVGLLTTGYRWSLWLLVAQVLAWSLDLALR